MATKVVMEFKKGAGRVHAFKIPAANWSAGGTLWFTAKAAIDNDATDALAVINKSFTDSVVTTETIGSVSYKTYTCSFVPADIVNVSFSNGEKKKKYIGEFTFVPASGSPDVYPADDNYIEVIIYADVKRGA